MIRLQNNAIIILVLLLNQLIWIFYIAFDLLHIVNCLNIVAFCVLISISITHWVIQFFLNFVVCFGVIPF